MTSVETERKKVSARGLGGEVRKGDGACADSAKWLLELLDHNCRSGSL